jgi:S-DNA-T family DNA segregation ATPase FtsK/SpoIIIE
VRVDLTVAGPAGDHDVVLSGPESAPLGGALASLAALAGAPGGGTLWLAERRLRPDDTVAAAGLRTGSVITVGRPGPVERAGMLSLHVLGGPAAGRSVALERGRVDIGRDPRCPIVLPDPDVSRRHAAIEVSAAGMTLRDLGSTNGTRLDGHPVPTTGLPLRPAALISVGDSLLSVAGPEEAPASVQPGGDGTLLVLRPPRHRAPSTVDEVLLPAAPRAARPHGVQWLAALLPALAGGILAWAFGSPQFLLFVLLSPVMMVGTALGDRLHWRRSRRRDAADFRQQQAIAQGRIADGLAAEGTARRDASPDPVAVLRQATMPGCRLWERRRDDPDALSVRGCAPATARRAGRPVCSRTCRSRSISGRARSASRHRRRSAPGSPGGCWAS